MSRVIKSWEVKARLGDGHTISPWNRLSPGSFRDRATPSETLSAMPPETMLPVQNQVVVGRPSNRASQDAEAVRRALITSAGIIEDAKRRANEIVSRAEEEAARLLDDARAEAEKLRERVRAEGFMSGKQEGREMVREKIKPLLAKVESMVRQAEALRRRSLELAEEDVLKLALAVAEKVIRREIQDDHEVTYRVLRETLPRIEASGVIKIRVNVSEMDVLKSHKDEFMEILGASSSIQLVDDPSIEPGGCVIETEFGRVDAGLETRLLETSAGLLELMSGAGGEQ